MVHHLVLVDLDPDMPPGTPVDVELAVDAKHVVTVSVRVQTADGGERRETATVTAAPAPSLPTRQDLDEFLTRLNEALEAVSGTVRSQLRFRADRTAADLEEALRYDDMPKAIVRMTELHDILQQAEVARGNTLSPPWPAFANTVRDCLELAAQVADKTGRDREELCEYVLSQERYAEQARASANQALYRECRLNLERYAGYLRGLLEDTLQQPSAEPTPSPEAAARQLLDRFRAELTGIWKEVRATGRNDLDARLQEIARLATGLNGRIKTDPHGALRQCRTLATELTKISRDLNGVGDKPPDGSGLLEGAG